MVVVVLVVFSVVVVVCSVLEVMGAGVDSTVGAGVYVGAGAGVTSAVCVVVVSVVTIGAGVVTWDVVTVAVDWFFGMMFTLVFSPTLAALPALPTELLV